MSHRIKKLDKENNVANATEGARLSKLKKLEQLAGKQYLNLTKTPPKARLRDDDNGFETLTTAHETETDLIATSPKRRNSLAISRALQNGNGARKTVSAGDALVKIMAGKRPDQDMSGNVNKTRESEKTTEDQIISNEAHDTEQPRKSPESEEPEVSLVRVNEVEKSRDPSPEIGETELDNVEGVEETQNVGAAEEEVSESYINNKNAMDQDFPNLKIANRVSPGDKFYKSLKQEKDKYEQLTTKILIAKEPVDTVDNLNNEEEKSSPLETSSIAQEMSSIHAERETSPTPLTRKRRKVVKKLEALKRVKLIHDDEAKSLLEDTQLFDSQDFDDSEVFQNTQILDTSIPCFPNEIMGTDPLLKETLEEIQFNSAVSKTDVQELQQTVLKRVTGKSFPLQLYGLDDHYHQLYRTLKNTITNLEGNSCLVMGARGTGKRSVMKKVIEDLRTKYRKQFITVNLSGSVQTDEKSAIRSIAQQIDLAISEYQGEETELAKITDLRNSNRTLRALLKVLDQNDLSDYNSKSIDRNLSVAIIFVIDEFDKFTEYNRQSLLYNLFDLSQNSNTPVLVIGLTTKVTAREMLEKRVKSRFSQKIISFNKPLLVDEFIEQFIQNCLVKPGEISNSSYGDAYNNYVIRQAKTIDALLHKHLVVNFYTIKNLKDSLSSMIIPISKLSTENPFPDFLPMLLGEDPYSNEIARKFHSLSDLELSLLLACSRIVVKSELNIVDLNSCYNEYQLMMNSLKQQRISSMTNFESATGVVIDFKIWSKKDTRKAWEKIQKLELIIDSSSNSSYQTSRKVNQNHSFDTFSVVVTLEELKKIIPRQSPLFLLTSI